MKIYQRQYMMYFLLFFEISNARNNIAGSFNQNGYNWQIKFGTSYKDYIKNEELYFTISKNNIDPYSYVIS